MVIGVYDCYEGWTVAGRVLVLDFDGTVCLGDGPGLRYADEVGALLGPEARRALTEAVTAFLAGCGSGSVAQDVYQVVHEHAGGLPPDRVTGAYRASRAALLAGGIAVHAPAGLADLLADLRPAVHVVVLTNAPQEGLDVLLERLGLAGVVDETIGDAGKPAGMGPVVERLLVEHGLVDEPRRLLSVGDLWENDLAAPARRGCATAHIDRFGRRCGHPDVRAATFEGLYAAVRAWAGVGS
jgi:phosphoglycolate phosphatase-like HAD superfamily hydrolase